MCSRTDEGQNVFFFILDLRIPPKGSNKTMTSVPLIYIFLIHTAEINLHLEEEVWD